MLNDISGRRAFIKKLLHSSVLLPIVASSPALGLVKDTASENTSSAQSSDGQWFGCAKRENDFFLLGFDDNYQKMFETQLPSRGHGLAIAKAQRQVMVVDRRPGRVISIFDADNGRKLQRIDLEVGLSYSGHASVHPNSEVLYVSGYQDHNSQGFVDVLHWANQRWELRERWSNLGIGPHELLAFEQGVVLAIGGIKTQGRESIELDNVQSQLLFLSHQGLLLKKLVLDNPDLSIRHISGNWDKLVIACQAQLYPDQLESLVYRVKQQQCFEAIDADAHYWPLFEGYIGSIAVDGNRIVASCPRSGLLGVWEFDGVLLQLLQIDEVCGLAGKLEDLVVSTGTGAMGDTSLSHSADVHWDNHLLAVSW